MPIAEPERKPNFRPRRIISIEAGNTDSMTPKCCMVIGRFAHMRMSSDTMVSTASADEAFIRVLLLWVSAWQIASSAMLRLARRGIPPDDVTTSATSIEPSSRSPFTNAAAMARGATSAGVAGPSLPRPCSMMRSPARMKRCWTRSS